MAESNLLFEFLRDCGLTGKRGPKIVRSLRKTELLDFAHTAQHVIASLPKPVIQSPYRFAANSSLSGGAWPCAEPICRVKQADKLARFASLYADHVLIRDPFEYYRKGADVRRLRERLYADLAVLYYLKPLFDAGLLSIAPSYLHLCQEHLKEVRDRGALIQGRLEEAINSISSEVREQLSISYVRRTRCAQVTGPESVVAHGTMFWGPVPRKDVNNGVLSEGFAQQFIEHTFAGRSVDDIYAHDWHMQNDGYNYLTDRPLDSRLIQAINEPQVRMANDALAEELEHLVPVLEGINLADLVKFRRNEGEAFQVYRDQLANVLRGVDLTDPKAIKVALNDGIIPELHKLDLAARNAHKMTTTSLRHDVVINAGIITVGVFLGLVQPALGAIISALGGVSAIKDAAKTIAQAQESEPPIVRENSFFFLWKLRKDYKDEVSARAG